MLILRGRVNPQRSLSSRLGTIVTHVMQLKTEMGVIALDAVSAWRFRGIRSVMNRIGVREISGRGILGAVRLPLNGKTVTKATTTLLGITLVAAETSLEKTIKSGPRLESGLSVEFLSALI